MEIDVSIERINNGYIVTGNDSTKNKHFYGTLEDFAKCEILETLREKDRCIRESVTPDNPFSLKLTTDI